MRHRLIAYRAPLCGAILAALTLVGPVAAHGGVYRGPIVPPPVNPIPNGVGGPTPGAIPGPTTGTKGTAQPGSWEVWWELNKDPLLQLREAVLSDDGPRSGLDAIHGGQDAIPHGVSPHTPTDEDRAGRILPALAALLQRERNRDVVTAALVGIARLGPKADDDSGIEVLDLFRQQLRRGDQEIRETAALAMGILGDPTALQDLTDLLLDNATGRRLLGREGVDDRTRAFAAYGLGILARQLPEATPKQAAHEALRAVLLQRELSDRDIRVAVQTAMGILQPRVTTGSGAHRRLQWMLVEDLWEFFTLDLGRGNAPIQCHSLTAIARLLGRGRTPEHARTVRRLITLLKDNTQPNATHQTTAQVLGMLTPSPDEVDWAGEAVEALGRYYQAGHDQTARAFAVLALGRIGGEQSQRFLIQQLPRSTKGRDRPWVGLGLGLLAHGERRPTGEGPAAASLDNNRGQIGEVLLRVLKDTGTPTTQDALAIALGLAGHTPALPMLRQLFQGRKQLSQPRGHFATALGMLEDNQMVEPMRKRVKDSIRLPALLMRTAVALGLLQDKEAPVILLRILQTETSTAVLGAAAGALQFVGDRRIIDPLIAALRDREISDLSRAFLAAALGGIGDRQMFPWNTCLTVDANYAARVDTLINGATGVLDLL